MKGKVIASFVLIVLFLISASRGRPELVESQPTGVDVYRNNPARAEPAAMGMADYGIGPSGPYQYATSSFVGIVTVYSLSTLMSGTSNSQASFQLNVNLEIQTSNGPLVFWIQNVAAVTTYGTVLGIDDFIDSVWNHTDPSAIISPSGISGGGSFGKPADPYGYMCSREGNSWWQPINQNNPTTFTLNVTSYVNSLGQPAVSFAFDIGSGLVTYDTVTFTNVIGFTSLTGFVVNGFSYEPSGLGFYDAELVLAGPGGAKSTTLKPSSGVRLRLEYWNGHNYQMVSNAYNFGADTGEGIDNVGVALSYYPDNGTMFAFLMASYGFQIGPLYNQLQIGVIDIISPLSSGTLYVSDTSNPSAIPAQIPWQANATLYPGEVTVTLRAGTYNLRLCDQAGGLYDQGKYTVNAGQTLQLHAPFLLPIITVTVSAVAITNTTTVFPYVQNYRGQMILNRQPAVISYSLHATYATGTTDVLVAIALERSSTVGQHSFPAVLTISMGPGDEYTTTVSWHETTGTMDGDWTISLYVTPIRTGGGNLAVNSSPALANSPFVVKTRTWPPDVNGDGNIGILDISAVAKALGATAGSLNWDPVLDVDRGGAITIIDITRVARVFGQTFTGVFK